MSQRSFFSELKRRNVHRAAVFYAASAWLLVQIATQVFPFFELPHWWVRLIVVAAAIGFPFALLFSWFYEWTPQGLKREREVEPAASVMHLTGKKLDRWIIAVLGVAAVLLMADRFVLHKDANAIPDESVAVLPLLNESGDKDEQYFSDGLSEDLISALSQFAGLKVISRNSSFQFRNTTEDSKTIGAKLGVAHLLEGSVRRAGEAVRISAELVNAIDGSTLWSQRYIRPYTDLFKLQDDITHAVAGELKAKLLTTAGAVVQSDHPPSGNLDAYNAYLQGKFYFARGNEADYYKSIDAYHAAVGLDPGYALAYANLSLAENYLAAQILGGAQALLANDRARAAADRALVLDPDLAAAHRARGNVLEWVDFDWYGAVTEYQRALELAPNDGSAKAALYEMRAALGHPEQAVALIRQALATDALNADSHYRLALYLMPLGRLDEAERASRKAIELQPSADYIVAQLAVIEILRGDAAAAREAAVQTPPSAWRDIVLAQALQIGGDPTAADTALKTLIDKHADESAFQVAETYALRRDPDKTFEWLDRAWINRDPGISFLLYDAFLLRYKDDARFAAYCRKVGLPSPAEVASAEAMTPASHAEDASPSSGRMP